MAGLRYEATNPMSRAQVVRELSSGVPDRIATALCAAARFDEDWSWVQEQCLRLAVHESAGVRWASVTCLTDLTFFRRPLNVVAVLAVLENALADTEISDPARVSLRMVK